MTGRWPANVILTPATAAILDEQSGERPGFKTQTDNKARDKFAGADYGTGLLMEAGERQGYNDSGGASRFFLAAGYEPWEHEWITRNGLTPCGE